MRVTELSQAQVMPERKRERSCFSETWLQKHIWDSSVSSNSFQTVQADFMSMMSPAHVRSSTQLLLGCKLNTPVQPWKPFDHLFLSVARPAGFVFIDLYCSNLISVYPSSSPVHGYGVYLSCLWVKGRWQVTSPSQTYNRARSQSLLTTN